MCSSGKVTYNCRADAKRDAKKIKGLGGNSGLRKCKMRPYQCRICQQWHLTSRVWYPKSTEEMTCEKAG